MSTLDKPRRGRATYGGLCLIVAMAACRADTALMPKPETAEGGHSSAPGLQQQKKDSAKGLACAEPSTLPPFPSCPTSSEEDQCEEHFRACAAQNSECAEAYACLAKPRCDLECIANRHASAEVYSGLCEAIPEKERSPQDLDVLSFKLAWRVFTALSHPDNAVQNDPTWVKWYSLHGQMPVAEQVNDDQSRDTCRMPSPDELEAFEAPTWRPPVGEVQARLSPAHNPLYYRLDGRRQPVRVESFLGPDDIYVKSITQRLHHQAEWSKEARRMPVERWAKRFEKLGPVHLKPAWVTLDATDPRRDDYICRAQTGHSESLDCLIAMHVALKTSQSGNYWLWATFEHNQLDELGLEGCGAGNKPLTKQTVDYDGASEYRGAVQAYNESFQGMLRLHDGLRPLANYNLVGVQRPVAKQTAHGPSEGVASNVWPPYLSNVVLEWDRQKSSCTGCHSRALLQTRDAKDHLKLAWLAEDPEALPGAPRSDLFWGYAFTACTNMQQEGD